MIGGCKFSQVMRSDKINFNYKLQVCKFTEFPLTSIKGALIG